MLNNKKIYIAPFLGFAILILVGWLLLMLPFSNTGNVTSLDALFSSVSATCVTGLTTVNIAENYTFLGQVILAIITEIGAIGFITFVSFILNIRKKKMPLSGKLLLSNALNETDFGRLKQRLIEVIKYTLVIELIGSIFLAIDFIPTFGIKDGIWYSIFHSITAFCNAGFDLFGTTSFTMFANNVYLNIVLIVLMLLGGIGFFVIEDIMICIKKRSFIHMHFHTKIVLATTFIIYFISVILIKLIDPSITILQALFMSTATRTTGFTTVNTANASELIKLLFSILMMIGGAPGSTSGGIKITSIAVLALLVYSTIREKKEVTVFYKKIDKPTIRQAITNITISNLIILVAITIFTKLQDIGIINSLFMCISAFSLTGLSVVEVGNLLFATKIILMLLMFIGRVGAISVISIFILNKKENKNIEYVAGNLMI